MRLKTFAKSESGTVSIEAALMAPLLLWAFIATFVFWDAFYAQSINMRAAYTVSDALSRETDAVDSDYMAGMAKVMTFLTKGQYTTRMRVSAVTHNDATDEFTVEWSWASDDSWLAHDNTSLADYEVQIPPIAKGDLAIIVESDLAFQPYFWVGLYPMTLSDFVVTRPRFGPQLTWIADDGTVYAADGTPDDPEDPDSWDSAGDET